MRLLVFNQYYWPGIEATAHLLHELCTALAEEYDVTVVTGQLGDGTGPGREVHGGLEIVRVPSTAFDRTRLSLRGLNYTTYLGHALWRGLNAPEPDVVLCMTDPPFVADIALVVARRFGAPLVVISQDVFPEFATSLGRLRRPAVAAVLGSLVRFYLRRADRVVAIGETMRRRLEAKGTDPERLRVISNWVDTEAITPRPRENPWAREYGLVDRFVVMHSGNVGHAQNLDALVRAATFLRDLEDLAVVIVGTGARHAALVELARRLEVDAITFLPNQPRSALSQSLSSADVHFVGLARRLSGYVVPSRLFGVLAVARPVIAAAEPESETAQTVERARCGVVVAPGRPELLAGVLREARAGRLDLAGMGARGREYVMGTADRRVAIGHYRALLQEVTVG